MGERKVLSTCGAGTGQTWQRNSTSIYTLHHTQKNLRWIIDISKSYKYKAYRIKYDNICVTMEETESSTL